MNTAAYSRPSITSPSTSSPLESALKSTIQGQEEDAEKYLKQKKVLHILQQLSSMVLFSKPDNPREFMIKKLEEMRAYKLKGMAMPTFSRENLSALFRMFDVTGKGSITLEKYFEAMKDIGVTNYNLKPRGHTENKISQEIFVDEA